MPPRRSVRRQISGAGFKKGDIVEFNLNGSTVKGKLLKKSPGGTPSTPLWIVAPSDRRRKNEQVPEKALSKVTDDDAPPTRIKRSVRSPRDTASSNSDESDGPDTHRGRRTSQRAGSSSEENSHGVDKKRKSDESGGSNNEKVGSRRVTFRVGTGLKEGFRRETPRATSQIGTRSKSTEDNGRIEVPPPPKKNGLKPAGGGGNGKIVKKDGNQCKVVEMLTGTLYLYRGERRRAEFVRFKY